MTVCNKPSCDEFLIITDLVRQRDNYTCQLCGEKYYAGKLIPVHHVHHDSEKCFTDFITLCESCHRNCNCNNIPEERCMNVLNDRSLLNWKYELKELMYNLTIVPKYKSWKEKSTKCGICPYNI